MKQRVLKIIKWSILLSLLILILSILFIRFSRYTDKLIYQTNGLNYEEFKSDLNYEQLFFDMDSETKIHGVLFKPDSINAIGTIFHFPGQGMNLNSSIQESYKPLLKKGFQIFSYERRGFGKSTGIAKNSLRLKSDALTIFDNIYKTPSIKNKPIIVWGQSLGGAFATMTVNNRQSTIQGLILEGTFNSFPEVGKVYARVLNLEKFKWLMPLIMNNDFPAEEEIKNIDIPVLIIHSKSDSEIPYTLGKKLFDSTSKNNTRFWEIDGKHIRGMWGYQNDYVQEFLKMMEK